MAKTLEEIEALPKTMLTANDITEIVGADANSIRIQAHRDASRLGFPVIVIGTRVKIPKEAFLKFMRGNI